MAISTLGPNDPQLFTPIQFLDGGLAIKHDSRNGARPFPTNRNPSSSRGAKRRGDLNLRSWAVGWLSSMIPGTAQGRSLRIEIHRHREGRSDVAISTLGPNDPQLFTPIQFLDGGLAIKHDSRNGARPFPTNRNPSSSRGAKRRGDLNLRSWAVGWLSSMIPGTAQGRSLRIEIHRHREERSDVAISTLGQFLGELRFWASMISEMAQGV